MSKRSRGPDTTCGTRTAPQGRRDDQPASDGEAADGEEITEGRRCSKEDTKRPGVFGTRDARRAQETDAGNQVIAKQLWTGSMAMPN